MLICRKHFITLSACVCIAGSSLAETAAQSGSAPGAGVASVSARLISRCAGAPCYAVELTISDDPRLATRVPYRVDSTVIARLRRDFGVAAPLVASALHRALPSRASDPTGEMGQLHAALSGAPHYGVRSGVDLDLATEVRLSQLARQFYQQANQRLWITSGLRSARDQAQAMYLKLLLKDRLSRLYRQRDAALAVQRAFTRGTLLQRPAPAVIRSMAAVIRQQVRRGTYLSSHLRGAAVDIRSRDMPRRARVAFLRLARRQSWVRSVTVEHRPPHFHLQLSVGETLPSTAAATDDAAIGRALAAR